MDIALDNINNNVLGWSVPGLATVSYKFNKAKGSFFIYLTFPSSIKNSSNINNVILGYDIDFLLLAVDSINPYPAISFSVHFSSGFSVFNLIYKYLESDFYLLNSDTIEFNYNKPTKSNLVKMHNSDSIESNFI